MRLTTTQVSLIAAAIALAVLGRIAAYVSEPAGSPEAAADHRKEAEGHSAAEQER